MRIAQLLQVFEQAEIRYYRPRDFLTFMCFGCFLKQLVHASYVVTQSDALFDSAACSLETADFILDIPAHFSWQTDQVLVERLEERREHGISRRGYLNESFL